VINKAGQRSIKVVIRDDVGPRMIMFIYGYGSGCLWL